jgi:hypothetical protein
MQRPRERVEKFVSTHTRTCDRDSPTATILTTANEIVKIDDETKFRIQLDLSVTIGTQTMCREALRVS